MNRASFYSLKNLDKNSAFTYINTIKVDLSIANMALHKFKCGQCTNIMVIIESMLKNLGLQYQNSNFEEVDLVGEPIMEQKTACVLQYKTLDIFRRIKYKIQIHLRL